MDLYNERDMYCTPNIIPPSPQKRNQPELKQISVQAIFFAINSRKLLIINGGPDTSLIAFERRKQ